MSDEPADISVITAVYDGVVPQHLDEALDSLARQTITPREVIVVQDGPLLPGHLAVIRAHSPRLPLRVIELPRRSGSGPARNAALEQARSTWVAIADADDISSPHRLQVQLETAVRGRLGLLGSAVEEIHPDTGQLIGTRSFAQGHSDIVSGMKLRNVINHPTVFMRRELALRAGGYRDLPLLEDYDLCVRLIGAGARVGNIAQPLVRFRGGSASQARRRAPAAFRSEWKLQQGLRAAGLVPAWRMPVNWLIRNSYRVAPRPVSGWAYTRVFLRSRPEAASADRPMYDRFVDMQEARSPIAESLARQVLATTAPALSKPLSELDVLDVGSGYGQTAWHLAGACNSVLALEPAEHLHRAAEALVQVSPRPNLALRRGHIEELGAVDAFDLVVLDNVYEHLPDQHRALTVISRSLRPGGVLFIVVPNKLWPLEVHYHLPFLSWLPLRTANAYLRMSGRGADYTDASYAPTYWGLVRRLRQLPELDFSFVLPGDPSATVARSPLHYRLGMRLLARCPPLWAISKAFVVVAVKPPDRDQSSPRENADSRSCRE